MFSHLLGHHKNKEIITTMLQSNRFPSVILLHGHEGVGKSAFARTIARTLIGLNKDQTSHPDYVEFFPDTKTNQYSMDEIRYIIQEANVSPFSAKRKVFVLHQFESVEERGNTFLKIFEDPPTFIHFICISAEKESILPTLLSRMVTFSFDPLSLEEIASWIDKTYKKTNVNQLALFASGSLSRAKFLCEIDIDTLFSLLEKSFLSLKEKNSLSLYKRIEELELFLEKHAISLPDIYECMVTWLQQYGLPKSHLLIEKMLQLSNTFLEANKKLIRRRTILEWLFFSLFSSIHQ